MFMQVQISIFVYIRVPWFNLLKNLWETFYRLYKIKCLYRYILKTFMFQKFTFILKFRISKTDYIGYLK